MLTRPLFFQYIQANVAMNVYVWMKAWRIKPNHWGLERILGRKGQNQSEREPFIGSAIGTLQELMDL